jgi:predicted DNA-binding transcriptional regulator AlpA
VPTKSNPNKQFLTSSQLRVRYGGRSDMWIGRLMKRDATFPRPVYIGRYRYWDLDAIEKYERDVTAQQRVA